MKQFILHFILLSGLINFVGFGLSTHKHDLAPEIKTKRRELRKSNRRIGGRSYDQSGSRCWCAEQISKTRKSLQKTIFFKISNVKTNARGDYLFFDVTIAENTKLAKYEFRSFDGQAENARSV